MIQTIISICSAAAIIALTVLLFLAFIASFIIAPKYEAHFAKVPVGIFNTIFPNIFGKYFSRPGFYMVNIIKGDSKHGCTQKMYYYGSYDFKVHAKKWEIIYSYIYFYIGILSVSLLSISVTFYFGAKLFNMPVTLT